MRTRAMEDYLPVSYPALIVSRYDAVVYMYHDQGHIPMKLLDSRMPIPNWRGNAMEEESALLARINQGLPEELRERLSSLRAKREDGTITDTEYEELTRLTLQAEELHAERMAAMVKLARLRGVTLPVLMDQLGIHFPENV